MLYELSFAAFAILVTWLWVRRNPRQAERTYHWIDRSRRIFGVLALVLISFTFLQSGVLLLQLLAIVLLVFGALYFFIERPDQQVRW